MVDELHPRSPTHDQFCHAYWDIYTFSQHRRASFDDFQLFIFENDSSNNYTQGFYEVTGNGVKKVDYDLNRFVRVSLKTLPLRAW